MKKIITFFILMFLINIDVTNAACSNEDKMSLNTKAANIKASYEIKEEYFGNEYRGHTEYWFDISIMNVSEEFYITVTNDYDKTTQTYRSSDTVNGIITFKWDKVSEVTNLTIKAYTSNSTNCPDESMKTLYLTLPRYNTFSNRAICEDYPDHDYCQKFVTFKEIDESTFITKITEKIEKEEIKEEEKNEDKDINLMDKIINFVDDYKVFILGGLVLILVIIIFIAKKKNKKQRELGL